MQKIRGVSFDKSTGRWRAVWGGTFIGRFATQELAATALNAAKQGVTQRPLNGRKSRTKGPGQKVAPTSQARVIPDDLPEDHFPRSKPLSNLGLPTGEARWVAFSDVVDAHIAKR